MQRQKRAACLLRVALVMMFVMISGPAAAQNGAYHVGPRDILDLKIHAGGEEQKRVEVTVSSDGFINIPFIGQVQTLGRTLTDLESAVAAALAQDYFVSPEVFISVKEYHSLHYFISGAVQKPGMYETSAHTNLLELIAKAGGVIPERGGVAYVLRDSAQNGAGGIDAETLLAQKEPVRVNLTQLLDQGDMTGNLQLESGDLVYIPLGKSLNQSESKIWVEGEIKNPGVFEYQPGMTALSACIIAGGFDKFAAPNRTRIVRSEDGAPQIIKVDLNDVKDGKIPDVELRPGDRIHVPETYL